LSAVEQVLRGERGWLLTNLQLDVDAPDRLIAPTNSQIDDREGSRRRSKLSPPSGPESAVGKRRTTTSMARVRIYGDTAVFVGRWRATGADAGQPFDYASRYVCV